MKKLLLLSIVFIGLSVCATSIVNAQGVGVNPSGAAAHPSAIFDASSPNQGMLIPRLTTAQRDAIVNPAQSLLIFNTTTNCFEAWGNVLWQTIWCAACPSPSAVNASASPNPLCEGSTLTLTGSATLASSWNWTGPNGFTSTFQNPTISGITTAGAGVYSLTASNICGSAAAVNTASITVNTVPTGISASATPNPVCEGATLTLTGSATGATAWSWTGPNGFTSTLQSPTISGVTAAAAGVYTLTASNACGAAIEVNTASVTINSIPTVVAASASPNPICEGVTLTLIGSATGATAWSWTGPNGFTSTLQSPAISNITTAAAGVYSLTASNVCGSAAAVNTASVTVNTVPTGVSASASPNPVCSGATLTLTGSATGATAWNWTGPNSFSFTLQSPTISGVTAAAAGVYSLTAGNVCGSATVANTASVTVNAAPSSAPNAGTHTPSQTQIAWNWNTVSGATGYKYNTTNNYSGATDNSGSLSFTQTGLACNTAYTLYIWAYNSCGNSIAATLTQTTSSCWTCGSALTINHIAGINGAPAAKTVNYGTVLTNLSGASKCWITQNLGSSNQATSVIDATDAAAGWYWQFNRAQGYINGSTNPPPGPTPTWTITSINENNNWLTANDPCALMLGAGWRIPTYTEWFNADVPWNSYFDAYASVLKIHAAGILHTNGALNWRNGINGSGVVHFWSSTQADCCTAQNVYMSDTESKMDGPTDKALGYSLRCIKD